MDADLFFVKVKAIHLLGKEATDYSALVEGFFHNHVRLRCDGELASVALANKVKQMAGKACETGDDSETQFCIQSC